MKLNKREQIIRDRMRSYQPDLDKDALWGTLSKSVPVMIPKRKKRRFGLFMLFLIPILLLSGVYIERSFIATDNIKPINFIESNIIQNDVNNINKETINQQDKNTINNSLVENNIFQNKVTRKAIVSKTKNNNSNLIDENKIYNSLIEKKEYKKDIINLNNNSFTIEKNIVNNDKKINRPVLDKRLKYLTPILNHLGLLSITHESINPPTTITTSFPRTINRNYFAWNFGIGIGSFDHSYEPKNSNSELFAKYFESSAKPSWSLNIGLTYYLGSRFYLSSGLEYTQLVTQVHPKWEKFINEDNPYPNGLTQRVVKQWEYEAIGHNYQNSIDIPLSIGANVVSINRFNLSIEVGALANVFTYSKGVVLDDNYKLYYYDNSVNNPYNRFKVGWHSSIVIDYKMSNNMQLYFQPRFALRTIEYKFSDLNIKEKYNIYDLKVGFRYKI